jgi:hypothetical protein
MKIRGIHFWVLGIIITTLACTHDEVQVEVVSPQSLNWDASCQRDSIVFSAGCGWRVESDCDWFTIEVDNGYGNGVIPVYVQQNDAGIDRTGRILLLFEDGTKVDILVCQEASDLNSYGVLVNLPMTYGVGWGYDYSVDHADIDGVRGQIVDEAKLNRITGNKALITEAYASTYTQCVSEQSSMRLIEKVSGSLSAGVDIKIASAKLSGSFSKQTAENVDRLYVWYRDMRSVRKAHMNVDLSVITKNCLTNDFKNAITALKKGGSIKDFVNKYGTHFIWNSTLGGKFDWYFTVSQGVKETSEKIVTTVTVKLLFWKKTSTSVDEKLWTEVKTDFIAEFEVTGGGESGKILNDALKATACKGEPLSDPDLITSWQNCFANPNTAKDDDLTMIDFKVYPIWDIVRRVDKDVAKRIEDYILNEYLK